MAKRVSILQKTTAFAGAVFFALLSSAAFAQPSNTPSAAPPPAFTIADVHASAHSNDPWMRGGRLTGDKYLMRDATMVDLVAAAYGVDPTNVLAGPAWLEHDRFDIAAKAPRTTSPETVKLMLRTLLLDRFNLVVHTDIKPEPAFVLSQSKSKPKLKQSASDDKGGCQFQPPPPNTAPTQTPMETFSCHGTTMESFAQFLHDAASPYLKNPVADATGLKGAWDFDIHWSYQLPRNGDSDGVSIFDAVDKQLGLKLEAKTAPLPVVIVDSVNEKPTPNPPGLDKAMPPPPPAEFEVAVVRPSAPDARGLNIMINGSGEITVQGASLESLITFAWDINTQMIADAPKWLDDDHWDIIGKASTDAPAGGPGSAPLLDPDDLKVMLRSLLADRFKLKTHMEDRPTDAYTLVAANPKMKKADPLNRTGCKTGPGPDGKDPRIANPNLGRLVTCQNMTMAQFAEQLQSMASGWVKTPVLDATGIEGAYDFTLSFSTTGQVRASQRGSGDAETASDPSGAISLPDALVKEIGVKMEKQKRPVSVLVIDHIEQKPTEN
jgi:uncharacterized protein (TIGR03435 family)